VVHRRFLRLRKTHRRVTHIFERFFLKCPYVRAREYLREVIEKAPLAVVPATIEKNVVVRYERGHDPLHFDEPWNVFWTPEGGGPYPDFTGELTIRADDTYRDSVLELQGDYAPPFGAVGRAFDIVLGQRIACSTAQTLLRGIAGKMEQRYLGEAPKSHPAA
jgi:hypothetical protein